MLHLRIVSPPDRTDRALRTLESSAAVCNIISLPGAARRPDGDVLLCDVAREDASIVLSDLRDLEIPRDGSIAIEEIDTPISEAATRAERAAPGLPSDAVVWEEVEARTSETTELSGVFLAFMVLAALIAAVGIYIDSEILIIGAMVVGPEFGPIAGICVALIQRRPSLARHSFAALAVGFPLAIGATVVLSLILRAAGSVPTSLEDSAIYSLIANPDVFSVLVALFAGVAGMLSLSTSKSGAIIGVLISVTTIPAAAGIGVSLAYGDWANLDGSIIQLGVNLVSILIAGTATLAVQRALYRRRRSRHIRELAAAGDTEHVDRELSAAAARSPG